VIRKIYILVFIFFLSFVSSAVNLDSLKQALKDLPAEKRNNPEDTAECSLIYLITVGTKNVPSLEYYANVLKTTAEKNMARLPQDHLLQNTYKKFQAYGYNALGIISCDRGSVVQALEFLHKSLKINEQIKAEVYIAACYNNIGFVYNDIGDLKRAIKYFEKSYDIIRRVGDRSEISQVLTNLGYFHYLNGNLTEALSCCNKSLKLAREISDDDLEAQALNRLGMIYAKLGDSNKAYDYYEKSLALHEKINKAEGIASNLVNLGDIYALRGNYDEALKYSTRALDINKKTGNIIQVRENAKSLKNIYEKMDNPKEALKMYEFYIRMRDSTLNESNRKQVLKKQLEYEYEKKELLFKEEQERIKRLYEQKQKFYAIIGGVFFLLVIIFFYSLYFRYKFKKEEESKNLHIELKEQLRQEIKEKEIIANSFLNIQEEEREKLAAELHDGVNQLLFAAKIQLQGSHTVEEEMHRDAVKLVDTAIHEIKSIASNQGSFLLNNKLLKDALTDLILQMKGNKNTRISFVNYGLEEEKLDQSQKTNILRIIQELLNNSIKHASAQNCYISIKTLSNKVIFAVTDTGKGIDHDKITHGNGLKNINNKVSLMKGRKRTFSLPLKGSKVYIEIPTI
jgi:two-component system NarL family sensor kinase